MACKGCPCVEKCEALAERLDDTLADLVHGVVFDWSNEERLIRASYALARQANISSTAGGSPRLARELLALVCARMHDISGKGGFDAGAEADALVAAAARKR